MTQMLLSLTKGVYFPNDVVEGRAVLSAPKAVQLRGVTLLVEGTERTSVTVSSGKHSHTYVSRNDILRHSVALAGQCDLPPGEHSYPFRFQLPPGALPGYRGRHASIIYSVTANADIPNWFDAHCTLEVPVGVPRQAVNRDDRRVMFQSTTAQDPLRPGFNASLKRCFFLAGETIEGALTLTTAAGKRIRKAELFLRTLETAVAQGHQAAFPTLHNSAQIPGDQLVEGAAVPFSLSIPRECFSSYQGAFSSLKWLVEINLDIALGFDVSATAEIAVVNAV